MNSSDRFPVRILVDEDDITALSYSFIALQEIHR